MAPLREMTKDEPAIAFMRTCGAMVEALRDAHEGLIFTNNTMTVLQARTRDFGEGEVLLSAEDWPRGQWFGNFQASRAAAILASRDEIESVITTASLMSHGYDYNGGSFRALIDGYVELLPAIVSAISPRVERYRIPWFNKSGRIHRCTTSGTIRALAAGLTDEERLRLLGTGTAAWNDNSVLDFIFFPVAQELGLDLTRYPQERIDEAMSEFESTLDEYTDDPDDENQEVQGIIYLSLFANKYAADLLDAPTRMTQEELERDFPWLCDWRPWQITTEAIWPPTLEDLRLAIAENNADG
jgi:hypothetical protein